MVSYQCRFYGDEREIPFAEEDFEAMTDGDAVSRAHRLAESRPPYAVLEVWSDERLVKREERN